MTTGGWAWPVRRSTTLFVLGGQYWIKPTFALPPVGPERPRDGQLLYESADVGQPGIYVATGTIEGPVDLTVQDGEHITAQDPGAWELVNDLELAAPGEDLIFTTSDDIYEELPRFELPTRSRLRVLLYARGVAEGRRLEDVDCDGPAVEQHLLQIQASSTVRLAPPRCP